ncbi:serine hydrolase domain-containing protein [Portibacter marinus]|uniref:serine hydrolase domain-containing protein n=1 Tax=Portibacter marinus TaxID=2898660 RepID=UPI001F26A65D|nr:serine hydrolase domain-containing protein [Portibacter marinus]
MKIIIIVFSFLFISASSFAQKVDELEQLIDSICMDWQGDVPGGAVGMVHKGELIFNKAYGLASLEYEVLNNTKTLFNIASVSKQITAYALVLLDVEGKISLDDDVRKYLPEVPDFGTPITIRHSLTHTSGLRNFQNLLSMAGWRDGDPMTNDDLLKYISRQKELNFPVGEEYLYCNTGFVLATFIVERVTGMDFKDWTKQKIFEPLGMDNTTFREDMEVVIKNAATGYNCNDGACRNPLEFYTYMGNGNVYTNVEDFAKWVNHFSTGEIGGQASIQQLLTRGILNNGDTLSYALGIGVNHYRGLHRISHGGSIGGFRSTMSYFPDLDFGIFIFSNTSSGNPGGKANEILSYCLQDMLQPMEPGTRTVRKLNQPGENLTIDYSKIVQQYIVDGIKVTLNEFDGSLYVSAEGLFENILLTPASDTSFYNTDADISLYVNVQEDKKENTLEAIFANDYYFGYALDPKLQDPSFFKQLLGTYYSEELDTRYVIEYIDNELFVTHRKHLPSKITPVTSTKLTADAFHFANAEIIYEDEAVKGLEVSNGRVRNVWFEKMVE